MPLGTLDRTPPPFFKQGHSALSKLIFFSALALLLMVADARFSLTQPLRSGIASALYPLQWLLMQPVQLGRKTSLYWQDLTAARERADAAVTQLTALSQRANQVEQLTLENTQLRQLLSLRQRLQSQALAAQVLYDAADPYTRKVVIDRGTSHGVAPGSAVVDAAGVLGQVTRVYPWISEVTLLSDRNQSIPVLNTRTGARSLAFGSPAAAGVGLELRYQAANADVREGDLLTTSGVDGVYPPGLPVARVLRVERSADSAFARIVCMPEAQVQGALHLLVLTPQLEQWPQRPAEAQEPAAATKRKGRAS